MASNRIGMLGSWAASGSCVGGLGSMRCYYTTDFRWSRALGTSKTEGDYHVRVTVAAIGHKKGGIWASPPAKRTRVPTNPASCHS